MPAEAAVATSLAVVGATSLVGSVLAWRRGHVQVEQAAWFAAAAMECYEA